MSAIHLSNGFMDLLSQALRKPGQPLIAWTVCGRNQAEPDEHLNITSDHAAVSCGTCLRVIHAAEAGT